MLSLHKHIVCFEMDTTLPGNEAAETEQARTKGVEWNLGSCSSTDLLGNQDRKTIYSKRCCLEPGEYILSCRSQLPHGWNGGYIEFQGRRYCDDFIGYVAMRRVVIKGKTQRFNSS